MYRYTIVNEWTRQGNKSPAPYIWVLLGTSWSEKWDWKKKMRNKVIHIDDVPIQYKDNFKQDNAVPFKMNRNVL